MKMEIRKVTTINDVWYRIFIDDQVFWSYATLEDAEKNLNQKQKDVNLENK